MTSRRIYRVDPLVQAYAKETSSDFKALTRRYKRLTASKRFQAAFPRYGDRPLVEGRGGGSYAHLSGHHSAGRAISLGDNRNEAVLLHEIAHHVAYAHPQYGPGDDHGPGFCAALLDVVKVAQGAEAEKALRHLYSALGLKVYRNGRAGRVRAPGDAPAKAQPVIDGILERKANAADKRAKVRAIYRANPDGTRRDLGQRKAECPDCAHAEANLYVNRVGQYHRNRPYTVSVYFSCDACDAWGSVRMPSEWQEPVKVAAR